METYTVRFKCPKCNETLSFEKPKNGVSPMAKKMRVFSEHRCKSNGYVEVKRGPGVGSA
jgi:transcription initiation factor IIE alpha subunit